MNPSQRKAVGSIVGTAFFVLILLSGYFFYTLMNQGEAEQQRVFSQMRSFDIERAQEALALNPGSTIHVDGADLLVSLKNTGSRPLNITRVGLWDETSSTWNYAPTVTVLPDGILLRTSQEQITGKNGLRVEPGATCSFSVTGYQAGGTYKIQFLTESGLLFTVSYP
jgi:hypothetical protein